MINLAVINLKNFIKDLVKLIKIVLIITVICFLRENFG